MFPIYQAKIFPNTIQVYVALVKRISFTLLYHTYILQTRDKQTHHTPVSYLKMRITGSGVVCWLLLKLAVDISYNKSPSYICILHLDWKLWVIMDAQLTNIAHHICV